MRGIMDSVKLSDLIKEFNPKYNIMLTDDKSYPYIEYISSPYPRLKVSRYLNIKRKDIINRINASDHNASFH